MTKHMDPARRKQARHAQKAKMKRRRRMTGLVVTAIILAVAAAAGWFFLGDHEPAETRPVETRPPETVPAETQAPRPQTGTTVIMKLSREIFSSTDKSLFDGFTEEELDTYISCLMKLQDNIKNHLHGAQGAERKVTNEKMV